MQKKKIVIVMALDNGFQLSSVNCQDTVMTMDSLDTIYRVTGCYWFTTKSNISFFV